MRLAKRQARRDLLEREVLNLNRELPQLQRQVGQQLEGQRRVFFKQGHKCRARKKQRPGLVQGLGVRREVLAGEHRDLTEGLASGEDVKNVLLAVRRELEDFHGAREDDVETAALVPFGKDQFVFSEFFLQRDAVELGELAGGQAAEERDPGNDVERFFHAVSFDNI